MTEPANGWHDITASRPWRAAPRMLGLPRGRLAGWVVIAAAAWFVTVWAVDLLLPDTVAVVIILIFAALITPPDPISQLGLSIPLYLLYEASILSVGIVEKRRAAKLAAEAAATESSESSSS